MTDIKVTQADRDASKIYWAGSFEDTLLMVLARHRIEAQRPLLEALEKAEWLHRTGLFNATPEQITDVNASRHAAIKQAKGE